MFNASTQPSAPECNHPPAHNEINRIAMFARNNGLDAIPFITDRPIWRQGLKIGSDLKPYFNIILQGVTPSLNFVNEQIPR